MLISDIRMKSRGVSVPINQSSGSHLAQYNTQHPGITVLITTSMLSFIVMTHEISMSCESLLTNIIYNFFFASFFRVIKS